MANDRQLAANPKKTKKPAGARISPDTRASSPNSIAHSLYCSLASLRQIEGAQDLVALHQAFRRDLRPHGAVQEALVEQLASIHHRLRRATIIENFTQADHLSKAGGSFEIAAARDHNVSHDALSKIARSIISLHREFRQTAKALREEQAHEQPWLATDLEQRAARGELTPVNSVALPPDSLPHHAPNFRLDSAVDGTEATPEIIEGILK